MRKTAILCALAAALAGCGVDYSRPTAPPAPRTAAQVNFDAAWNASLKVLRDYRFTVSVENRRDGTITSSPLVGRQYFEFWRKDSATPQELAEDNFQTIYRTAIITVRLAPGAPDSYVADVTIQLTRSDKPAVTVTSTSEAYGLFSMSGGRSDWVTTFGRSEEEEERLAKPSGTEGLRAGEGLSTTQPTTKKVPAAAKWLVPLGRDGPMERDMSAAIASALGHVQQAGH